MAKLPYTIRLRLTSSLCPVYKSSHFVMQKSQHCGPTRCNRALYLSQYCQISCDYQHLSKDAKTYT